jgi:cardiolipin synthase
MREEWFDELIDGWDPKLAWSASERSAARALCFGIALRWAGDVVQDEAIDEASVRAHAFRRVTAVLDALVRSQVRRLQPPDEALSFYEPVKGFKSELDLTPVRYRRQSNVNRMSRDELRGLPEIGDAIADRILEFRRRKGSFAKLDRLVDIDGISAKTLETLRRFVYAAPLEHAVPLLQSETFDQLACAPTFAKYVRFAHATGLTFSLFGSRPDGTLAQRLLAELEGIASRIAELKSNPFSGLPAIRASQLREQERLARKVADMEAKAPNDDMHGVLLEDSAYGPFVLDLLEAAKASLRIVMFFMRFEDKARYPTDDVIAAVVAARKREVDVKVILDRDAEGSVIGAMDINQEVYDHFTKHGVPVRWDSVERTTHTKLVVVDKKHTVVGSHNWTAGSFFAYDDQSLYVSSASLGGHYFDQVEALWAEYA